MNGVMIIPTGIGCEIGGHAGDANPAAKLIASVCDTLVLHPNVVNASDINEIPENCLYVEGSILDKFLQYKTGLRRVRSNKILVAVNPPLKEDTVNAVSAARATIGLDAEIVVLDTPLEMIGHKRPDGSASGIVTGLDELVKQVSQYDFDALAVASPITVGKEAAEFYLKHGGVNPWGGVEAIASRKIAERINKPVAHAPIDTGMFNNYNEIVDPRLAAEMVSVCYLHCVLKGLHKAPRIGGNFTVSDIDFMVSPWGIFGTPHLACSNAGIPIISVEENTTCLGGSYPNCIKAKTYLEAVGIIKTLELGMTIESVTRPINKTKILE